MEIMHSETVDYGYEHSFLLPIYFGGQHGGVFNAGSVKVYKHTSTRWVVSNITTLPVEVGASGLYDIKLTDVELTPEDQDKYPVIVTFILGESQYMISVRCRMNIRLKGGVAIENGLHVEGSISHFSGLHIGTNEDNYLALGHAGNSSIVAKGLVQLAAGVDMMTQFLPNDDPAMELVPCGIKIGVDGAGMELHGGAFLSGFDIPGWEQVALYLNGTTQFNGQVTIPYGLILQNRSNDEPIIDIGSHMNQKEIRIWNYSTGNEIFSKDGTMSIPTLAVSAGNLNTTLNAIKSDTTEILATHVDMTGVVAAVNALDGKITAAKTSADGAKTSADSAKSSADLIVAKLPTDGKISNLSLTGTESVVDGRSLAENIARAASVGNDCDYDPINNTYTRKFNTGSQMYKVKVDGSGVHKQ